MFALEHKRDLPGAWGWMFASGLVDLILGGVIVAGLPGAAEWAIGLLVAINMVFGGVALVAMALQARRIEPGVATAIGSSTALGSFEEQLDAFVHRTSLPTGCQLLRRLLRRTRMGRGLISCLALFAMTGSSCPNAWP